MHIDRLDDLGIYFDPRQWTPFSAIHHCQMGIKRWAYRLEVASVFQGMDGVNVGTERRVGIGRSLNLSSLRKLTFHESTHKETQQAKGRVEGEDSGVKIGGDGLDHQMSHLRSVIIQGMEGILELEGDFIIGEGDHNYNILY